MSLSSALESALTGLRVSQANVALISNNIANADNEDFTKKQINTEAIVSASGQGGVRITGYSRAVDTALQSSYVSSISDAAMDSTMVEYYSDIKNLYGISSDTAAISSALSNFTNAWKVMTSAPESVVNRTNVLTAGQAVAAEIKRLAGGVETLDRQIRSETTDSVTAVNSILKGIQTLNGQIASGTAGGSNVTDLEDQRDAQIRALAQYVDIKVLPANQGAVRIITPQGFTLLDIDPTPLSYNGTDIVAGGQVISPLLSGGKIQALLDLRADKSPATASAEPGVETIRKLRDQLDQLASSFLQTTGTPTTFAAAYNNAATVPGEQQTDFFTGTGRFDIGVNSNLLNGTTTLKAAAAQPADTALADSSRTFTTSGLSVQNVSYLGYVNAMLSGIGNDSSTIKYSSDLSTATMNSFKERYTASSNVNVDQELMRLTQVQNSYSTSARVVTVVNQMFDTLNQMMAGG